MQATPTQIKQLSFPDQINNQRLTLEFLITAAQQGFPTIDLDCILVSNTKAGITIKPNQEPIKEFLPEINTEEKFKIIKWKTGANQLSLAQMLNTAKIELQDSDLNSIIIYDCYNCIAIADWYFEL
jgi:hypothetical protein